MTSVFSWQNTVSLCPASFCTPRANLPAAPGFSWLLPFAFQSSMMKKTSFLVLVLQGVVGLYRNSQLQFLWHYVLGINLDYCDAGLFAWKWIEIILSVLRLHPSTAFELLLTMRPTPFLLKVRNAVLGCNLKNDRMISVLFQGKPFNITVIQVYAPTSNAEEAEVDWFCEDI